MISFLYRITVAIQRGVVLGIAMLVSALAWLAIRLACFYGDVRGVFMPQRPPMPDWTDYLAHHLFIQVLLLRQLGVSFGRTDGCPCESCTHWGEWIHRYQHRIDVLERRWEAWKSHGHACRVAQREGRSPPKRPDILDQTFEEMEAS